MKMTIQLKRREVDLNSKFTKQDIQMAKNYVKSSTPPVMLMSKEVTPLCRMPEANKNNDPKCW
jgi:muconolactone delta-isomerase